MNSKSIQICLTVNIFECKTGILFPESESEWDTSQLLKVLSLCGMTELPQNYSYFDITNLFLYKLNVQKPFVYALSVKIDSMWYVILNSQTIEIQNGGSVNIGPYAKLVELHRHQCGSVWNEFMSYVTSGIQQRFIIEQFPEELSISKQMKILELEKENAKLKNEMKTSSTGRLQEQFIEANNLLHSYKSKIDKESSRDKSLVEKNAKLVREYQTMEAKVEMCKQELEKYRTQLAGSSLDEALKQIQILKRKLSMYGETSNIEFRDQPDLWQ